MLHVFVLVIFFCNLQDVYSAGCDGRKSCDLVGWNVWGACDVTCGGGTRKREKLMCCDDTVKPHTLENCLKHCKYSQTWWATNATEHQTCNTQCYHGSYNMRLNQCDCDSGFEGKCCDKVSPKSTTIKKSFSCDGQYHLCDIQPWTNWSPCSGTCGVGARIKSRPVCCDPAVIQPFDVKNCLKYCKIDFNYYVKNDYIRENCGVCGNGTYDAGSNTCICNAGYGSACCDKVVPITTKVVTKKRTTLPTTVTTIKRTTTPLTTTTIKRITTPSKTTPRMTTTPSTTTTTPKRTKPTTTTIQRTTTPMTTSTQRKTTPMTTTQSTTRPKTTKIQKITTPTPTTTQSTTTPTTTKIQRTTTPTTTTKIPIKSTKTKVLILPSRPTSTKMTMLPSTTRNVTKLTSRTSIMTKLAPSQQNIAKTTKKSTTVTALVAGATSVKLSSTKHVQIANISTKTGLSNMTSNSNGGVRITPGTSLPVQAGTPKTKGTNILNSLGGNLNNQMKISSNPGTTGGHSITQNLGAAHGQSITQNAGGAGRQSITQNPGGTGGQSITQNPGGAHGQSITQNGYVVPGTTGPSKGKHSFYFGTGTGNTNTMTSCLGDPCVHGTCVSMGNKYLCLCDAGFSGKDCELDKDECETQPCVYGQCVDQINGYHCECNKMFTGKTCSKMTIWGIASISLGALAVLALCSCCAWCIATNNRDDEDDNKVEPIKHKPKPQLEGKPNAWLH